MQISYQDWSDFLLRVGAICSPAELHGVLCGIQCRGPAPDWKLQVRTFMDLLDENHGAAVDAALEAQYDLISGALLDGQYGLQLLLPEVELPLVDRAGALALWCQGFLLGFGEGGAELLERLDGDTREAVADLAQIAQLDDSCGESEECEQDLLELVEYVRMTLFSIVAQLHPVSAPAALAQASATRH
jgi:uncharacterized protein YgfB (UPF0149 family)